MRVALVCGIYAPDRDGVADYLRRLAAELPAVGVVPVLAAAGSPTSHADGIDASRVESNGSSATADDAVPVTPSWSLRHLRRAARRLDALGCDVVHVQFAPSAYGYSPAVGWLPALLRTPVVTTLHEYGWWSWPNRVPDVAWRRLERARAYDRESALLGPRSRALITTNAGHRAAVLARLRRNVELIPIGANVPGPLSSRSTAARLVRDRLRVPDGVPLLVFFGFVHPVKGVRELVDAVAALRDRGRRVRLVVAGGFASLALRGQEAVDFRAELEQRITDRRVTESVTLTGYLRGEEVSQLLSAADAVVLPFTAGVTTKSGSLVAALAHGAPVLATVPDEPDPELRDGETVVAIGARRDAAAIATALVRVLDDADLARRVAAGGRQVAALRSWPIIAGQHAEVYRRMLSR